MSLTGAHDCNTNSSFLFLLVLKGGPLSESYRLRQFHFHWGITDDCGSEHLVDGAKFSAELHLVHWNSAKYPSFADAASKADGLALIGVLVKVSRHNDTLLFFFFQNKKAPFTNFDPSVLLPPSLDYWAYSGSLTHPPLHESVTWIIFKETISASSEQLAQFRCLLANAEGDGELCIKQNHRPPQPLKGRTVKASF
uniref:Carbonic anhydrase n=1 Tax=Bos indicus x Bos taurus TaxID=30522 RepID=A0A4W2E161_BOBOX